MHGQSVPQATAMRCDRTKDNWPPDLKVSDNTMLSSGGLRWSVHQVASHPAERSAGGTRSAAGQRSRSPPSRPRPRRRGIKVAVSNLPGGYVSSLRMSARPSSAAAKLCIISNRERASPPSESVRTNPNSPADPAGCRFACSGGYGAGASGCAKDIDDLRRAGISIPRDLRRPRLICSISATAIADRCCFAKDTRCDPRRM